MKKINIKNLNIIYFLIIFLCVVCVYFPSFKGEYIFDDGRNILYHYTIFLKDFTWSSLKPLIFQKIGGFRPSAHLSFALNYYFFGIEPLSFHIVNVIIHISNSILVFFVIKNSFKYFIEKEPNINIVFLSTLFFSVATIQTSAVSYIVQRMASASTFFLLLAIFLILKEKYFLTLIMWLIALGFKENSVILPFIILWAFWIKENKNLKLLFKISFFLFFVIILFISFGGLEYFVILQKRFETRDFTMWERVLTQPRVVFHYFSLILFPYYKRFCLHYDFGISSNLFTPITTLLSIFILFFVFIGIFRLKNKYISFWAGFIFLSLFIESSFLPLDMVYEHRMYFPMLGVCALSFYFVQHYNSKILIALFLIFIYFNCFNTFMRNSQYKSYQIILENDLRNYPNNKRALFNLYGSLKNRNMVKAHSYLSKCLSLKPTFYNAYTEFVQIIIEKYGTKEGIVYLKNILKSNPNVKKQYLIMWKIAKLYEKENDIENAQIWYLNALKIKDKSIILFRDYGIFLFEHGKTAEGYDFMKKAYEIDKYDPLINYYLYRMTEYLNLKKEQEVYKLNYKRLYIKSKYHNLPKLPLLN